MSKFLRDVKVTIPFDGADLQFTLRPIATADVMAIRGCKDDLEATIAYGRDMLARYVKEHTPILDSEGQPVSLEDVGQAAYFGPLVAQLMEKHIDAAIIRDPPSSAGQSGG